MNNKVQLIYLIILSFTSNFINVIILILANRRGGDVAIQLKYTGWMIVVWIISFSLAVLVPNTVDDVRVKNYNLLRAIAIILCTPIPFMVGCAAFIN